MRWARKLARMGEKRNAYKILVRKPKGKKPLGIPRRKSLSLSLSLSLPLAPQPSLGLGLLHKLLPIKTAEFLGGFSTIFFFTG
jgi:hypothetical protein